MKLIAIIYKSHSPEAQQQAEQLTGWLQDRGLESYRLASGPPQPGEYAAPPLALRQGTDLITVLGGDGTMLGAVRAVVAADMLQVPILGVNMGGLGFLTALSPEELLPAMERVREGDYQAPARMMLRAQVMRAGQEVACFTALNDVVINKAAMARIVELDAKVDGAELTIFRADGLIVSSPTGSTAYNLSAGGPICHPGLDCIVLTPICSFALSNRPLLLDPAMRLTVELSPRALETSLTCDGQVGLQLLPGDAVAISRAPQAVRIVSSPFKGYFEILRTKLKWG